MKKLLFAIVAFSAFNMANAQEASTSQENVYKPQGGDWNAELNFSPFSSSPISLNYLRYRKFLSNTSAMRLGVSLGYESEKPNKDEILTDFTLNLRPGFEEHFGGTDRLSPYIGGELDIAVKSVKYEDTDQHATIKGAWNESGTNNRGFLRMGMNLIIGADYYVAKKLYIGTEFGYGFEIVNTADVKVEISGTNPDPIKGGNTFQLGPNFNSSLRLGFVF